MNLRSRRLPRGGALKNRALTEMIGMQKIFLVGEIDLFKGKKKKM